MKRGILIGIIAAGIIVVLIAMGIVFFGYSHKCSDERCFNAFLAACKRSSWIYDAADATWQYDIKGKGLSCYFGKCSDCVVSAKLIQVKKGTVDIEKLQGLSMDCYLLMGFVTKPQSDLAKCHGILKEGLQDLIIVKMHSYIASNLGKIAAEFNKTIGS